MIKSVKIIFFPKENLWRKLKKYFEIFENILILEMESSIIQQKCVKIPSLLSCCSYFFQCYLWNKHLHLKHLLHFSHVTIINSVGHHDAILASPPHHIKTIEKISTMKKNSNLLHCGPNIVALQRFISIFLLTFNSTLNKCGDTTYGRRKWISSLKMSKWQELNTQKGKTSMCIIFTSHKMWKWSIIKKFTLWDWICKHYNKTCSSFCANKATRLL